MQRSGISMVVLCVWMLLVVAVPTQARDIELPAKDFAAAKDHPMMSRFPGSMIIGYLQKDYDELVVPLDSYTRFSPNLSERFRKVKVAEGRITEIAYAVPAGKSTLEIFRNYQHALTSAGFETIFACSDKGKCGNLYNFANALKDRMHTNATLYRDHVNFIINANGGELRHTSNVLRRPKGDVYVTLTVTQSANQLPGVLVRIAEEQPMQTNQVTVDAKAIGDAIAAEGKIALYGITFDVDSANITAESRTTLVEMATYLKNNARTKVHIVGHTDNTGALEHNQKLSQSRAEAVVKALIRDHGIAADRLNAKGVASFAPVASNRSDDGRGKNRRVEMVEQ